MKTDAGNPWERQRRSLWDFKSATVPSGAEGVCDTSLQIGISNPQSCGWAEGVCDTPLQIFAKMNGILSMAAHCPVESRRGRKGGDRADCRPGVWAFGFGLSRKPVKIISRFDLFSIFSKYPITKRLMKWK
jgi:hypothetical protein